MSIGSVTCGSFLCNSWFMTIYRECSSSSCSLVSCTRLTCSHRILTWCPSSFFLPLLNACAYIVGPSIRSMHLTLWLCPPDVSYCNLSWGMCPCVSSIVACLFLCCLWNITCKVAIYWLCLDTLVSCTQWLHGISCTKHIIKENRGQQTVSFLALSRLGRISQEVLYVR